MSTSTNSDQNAMVLAPTVYMPDSNTDTTTSAQAPPASPNKNKDTMNHHEEQLDDTSDVALVTVPLSTPSRSNRVKCVQVPEMDVGTDPMVHRGQNQMKQHVPTVNASENHMVAINNN